MVTEVETQTKPSRHSRSGLTEREAAALREQVPDLPRKAVLNEYACEFCGVGVVITDASQVRIVDRQRRVSPDKVEHLEVPVARCEGCRAVQADAAAYLEAHPELVARFGNVVQERVEQALFALQVLARPRPSEPVFAAVWPRLWEAARALRWGSPLTVIPERVNPHPWAHVGLTQRQDLRRAYAAGLQNRVLRTQAPIALPCPSVACLFCGVPAVRRPASQVVDLGGVHMATRRTWTRLVTFRTALGGEGPEEVTGHLCPACQHALGQMGGVGIAARGQALVNYVQSTAGEAKAQRLADRLARDLPPPMPAWAVIGAEPNGRPWAHLSELLVRL